MLLTMTMGGPHASSLPELLNHPADEVVTHELPFGKAHVFFPAVAEECQLAFLLEVHARDLEMGDGPFLDRGPEIGKHFNHRPYSANAHLAIALHLVFGELMEREEGESHPLRVEFPAVPASKEAEFETIFTPLGYSVKAQPLENQISHATPRFFALTLEGRTSPFRALRELLTALLCLDQGKLYWTKPAESAALVELASPVLESHPEREAVAQLLARGQDTLFDPFLRKLVQGSDPEGWQEAAEKEAEEREAHWGLGQVREDALLWLLSEIKPQKVLDFGCGKGRLIWRLLNENIGELVGGMDISSKTMQEAGRNIVQWGIPPEKAQMVRLQTGSLVFRDDRIKEFDAIVLQEVICQLGPYALEAMTANLFDFAHPAHLLITLPNADFNPHLKGLPNNAMRHPLHRFEWSADRISQWAEATADAHGYALQRIPIGESHPESGPPSFLLYFHLPTNS